MAAGIIALALEANPSLTWRDVQHLIVKTSQPRNLKATDWRTNGMKRKVSHSYGYGIMDTGKIGNLDRIFFTNHHFWYKIVVFWKKNYKYRIFKVTISEPEFLSRSLSFIP